MRVLNYKAEQLSSVVIPLGVQGETGATLIRIDFSEWLLDGTAGYPVLTVLDPEGVAYIAATRRTDERQLVENEDGTLSYLDDEGEEAAEPTEEEQAVIEWPVTDVDTVNFGDGAIRLVLFDPKGVILKSAVARTSLTPSFLKNAGEAPGQFEYWLQQLAEYTAESGSNRAIAQHAAEKAVASAESAAGSENAAMAYADIVKAAAAAAASGSTLPDIVMNLTTTIPFAFDLTDWTQGTGSWSAELANGIITGHVGAIFMPTDASAKRMNDGAVLRCTAGKVTVITGEKPSGRVEGTLILCGRFAPDGAEDDGSDTLTYWPRRASVSVGTVTTGEEGTNASVTVTEGQTLNFVIPRGATGATGPQGPQGPQGPSGEVADNFKPMTDSIVESLCNEVLNNDGTYVRPDANNYYVNDETSARSLLTRLKAFFTPMARTVNGKALNGNITLAYTDVDATKVTVRTVTLASGSWSSKAQTVNCTGVTANNQVIVSPNAGSYLNYHKWKVRCTGQAAGKLTFATDGTPSANLTVQVLILDGTKT